MHHKITTKMSASSSQVEGDQDQMLIAHAFCCFHGFLFPSDNKFATILTTFMLHSFLALIPSFFHQLVNDMLRVSTLPFCSPCLIFRTVYLLLQCFVFPLFCAVFTLHFSSDLPYNFGAGNISVAIHKSKITYSLVSLLIPSCLRGMCD